MFIKTLTLALSLVVPAAMSSAESYKDDFSEYPTPMAFSEAYYTYLHPPGQGQGSAMLDTTAGAVILTAQGPEGNATFTLTQLLNLQHKHQLGADHTVAVEAEFDDAGNVPPWAPEPIAPNRVGLSGQGVGVWGQVGVSKKGDPKGTLVAKVAVAEKAGERVVAEVTTSGFGTYDEKSVRLVVTGKTLDLLIDGQSVIDGPQPHDIDWSSELGEQQMQAYVQQQRVYAPQPRSCIVNYLAVDESAGEPD